jgi:hypothetical protein
MIRPPTRPFVAVNRFRWRMFTTFAVSSFRFTATLYLPVGRDLG